MNIQKNPRLIAIALALMLTTGIGLLPAINFAKAANFYAYITVSPNPIGVGQQVLVEFGIIMPTVDPYYYSGWMLTITSPSGTNQTLGPYTSDASGGTHALFTPSAVGTWRFQAYYPGGNLTYPAKPPFPQSSFIVPPESTQQVTLTVQQQQLSYLPTAPLPTDYWQWPVYSDNYLWYSISGNWLMSGYDTVRIRTGAVSGVYDPYTTAPTSAHILWTQPWILGGVAGGTAGVNSYYTGSNYREEVTPPIIINGRIYYNQVDPPGYGFYCVDLYTGKTIWFQNQTFLSGTNQVVGGSAAQLTLGQVLITDTENQNGAVPYLWSISGTTWARYDAFSGNLLNTIVNATAASSSTPPTPQIFGPNGELLVYYFDLPSQTLALWNSTRVVTGLYSQTQALGLSWKTGIQWNVTVPTCPNEAVNIGTATWDPKNPTMLILTNQTQGNPLTAGAFTDIAYSTTDGHMLWTQTRNTGGDTWELLLYSSRAMGDGMYTIYRKETRQIYAYNATTGNQMWVSDILPNVWDQFATGLMFAYGNIYMTSYSGILYCFNEATGKIIWTWSDNSANPSNLETPYGDYPFYAAMVAANGMIFLHNQEHTENSPLYRGEAVYAVNANNGTLAWMMNGQYKEVTIAGGNIVSPCLNDGQIYTFGKGPTKTTVSTVQTAVPKGQTVIITGTVTDQSPGQPNTPCISDASMEAWMEYVHQQQPMPNNATGVSVTITTFDPNNNTYLVGTTTSDTGGGFGLAWTPPVPGLYRIIATFKGTNSYGSSYATTYLYVNSAPAAQTTSQTSATNTASASQQIQTLNPSISTAQTQNQASTATILTNLMLIAIAAAIVIIVIAAALVLRKRTK
jgi:outer membrane protein assembly factor BamB